MSDLKQKENESLVGGLAVWDREPRRAICNFDGDDRQQFSLRMRCMAASSGGDPVGKEFDVRYWMVHEVDFESQETGEIVRTYRTVFVSPDGQTVSVVSEGVAAGVHEIFQQFGNKPLDPPLRLKINQIKTGRGRRFYQLVPVQTEQSVEQLSNT